MRLIKAVLMGSLHWPLPSKLKMFPFAVFIPRSASIRMGLDMDELTGQIDKKIA